MNYDQWKLMSPDGEGCSMVSDCCGSEYELWDGEEYYICSKCGDECITIEDYEYEAIQRENYLEDMRDE